MLDCGHFLEWLHPWVDGELDLMNALEMERHLDGCASCLAEYTVLKDLKSRLSQTSLAFAPPARLSARVHEKLISESRSTAAVPAKRRTMTENPARRQPSPWVWAGAGGVLVAVFLMAFPGIPVLHGKSRHVALAEEMISCHIRSLQAGHLFDVASTDQHTVKPWFQGKLDFSPPVDDFSGEGFPLAGGRLDYLDNKPVAVLVYHRHLHAINLFCWPDESDAKAGDYEETIQGYRVLIWTQSGFRFGAVSDVNETDLRQFMQLQRQPH